MAHLEFVTSIQTYDRLTVWNLLDDVGFEELPLYCQRSVRTCRAGLFNVYIERDNEEACAKGILIRRDDKTTPERKNKGFKRFKLPFLKNDKRQRTIEINRLAAIGDRVSSDNERDIDLTHLSLKEYQEAVSTELGIEDSVAIELSGLYKCQYDDNEVYISLVS